MLDKIYSSVELARSLLFALKDTDLGQVSFGSVGLALGAGLFLLAAVLYKLLWGKNKFRHYYSGHEIPAEYNESKAFSRRLICVIPKTLLSLSAIFLILAIANPYLPRTKIETIVESRERVELLDNSSSMGWEFGSTRKSACEIVRETHLKFLKMRQGQNDRVALWVFSNNAYIKQDFIIDDEVYKMQVEDAPCVMVYKNHDSLPENDPSDTYVDIIAPQDKVKIVEGEGGTNLIGGLKAAINYFDQRGRRDIKRKSIIIVTDAAVDADPEQEFKELKKRGIVSYMIHIKPNEVGERQFNNSWKIELAESLKKKVKQYGGIVFNVEDRRSAELAYAAINRLETSPVKIIRHLFKVLIFQRPLVAAVVLAMLSVVSGILASLFFEEFP